MLEEKSFDYILFGIITLYSLYIIMKNNEQFSNNTECSDNDINLQILDYVLTKNDKTKNIELFTNTLLKTNVNKPLRRFNKSILSRRRNKLNTTEIL